MADSALDWVKAGTVEQNAVSQGIEGLQQGAQLAQAYDTHQSNMQAFQQKQAQFKEHQAGWVNDQLSSILGIQNPTARAFKWKQFQQTAQQAGVNVDPAIEPLIRNDDFVRKGQMALARNNNLPYNEGTAARMDIMNMLGDAAQTEKSVHGAGELQTQMAQYTLSMQQAQANKYLVTPLEQEKVLRENQTQIHGENKDRFETLGRANLLLDAAENPEQRKDPYANAAAQAFLAKELFPGGVIRESEMQFLDHINPGLGNKMTGWFKKTGGKGNLTEDQWQAIAALSQKVGDQANNDLQRQKVSKAKALGKLGISAEDAFAGAPEWKPRDLSASFPGLRGQSTMQAQQQPNTQPSSPAAAPSAPNPVDKFTALAPDKQAQLQALAARSGIKLDPKSPQFGAQWMSLRHILEQHKSMTAGGGGQ